MTERADDRGVAGQTPMSAVGTQLGAKTAGSPLERAAAPSKEEVGVRTPTSSPRAGLAGSEMTVGSLFSGIGGLDLGLERAGMRVVWQAEIEPFCASVLAKHWLAVPNLGDVTLIDWSTVERPRLLAGGFPCQPVSDAGLKLAQDDPRWLWPEMRRAIDALRPEWVVIENVPGLRNRGLAAVRDDLAALDYLARPVTISACELGAPHARARLFTLAHAAGLGCRPRRNDRRSPSSAGGEQQDRAPSQRDAWWADEPDVGRVAYGVPGRVDRVRALGNAVIPHIGELIGERIMAVAA